MIQQQLCNRYARALLGLCSPDQADSIDKEFLSVRKLLQEHPKIKRLIKNPIIARVDKVVFLEKILADKISNLLLNFLKVLVQKQRFREAESIQKEFHKLYEKQKGVQEVQVLSAIALPDEARQRLRKVLKRQLRAEIRLLPQTDPELLGGLVLRFENIELNASYRYQLQELGKKLVSSY